MPAKAGTHDNGPRVGNLSWIPASAGMTLGGGRD